MKKSLIRCFECDSEYVVEYDKGLISDELQFCMICKEPIESDELEIDEEELE